MTDMYVCMCVSHRNRLFKYQSLFCMFFLDESRGQLYRSIYVDG